MISYIITFYTAKIAALRWFTLETTNIVECSLAIISITASQIVVIIASLWFLTHWYI
jgi:hypothetical protein